jgi:hypothetical protein
MTLDPGAKMINRIITMRRNRPLITNSPTQTILALIPAVHRVFEIAIVTFIKPKRWPQLVAVAILRNTFGAVPAGVVQFVETGGHGADPAVIGEGGDGFGSAVVDAAGG